MSYGTSSGRTACRKAWSCGLVWTNFAVCHVLVRNTGHNRHLGAQGDLHSNCKRGTPWPRHRSTPAPYARTRPGFAGRWWSPDARLSGGLARGWAWCGTQAERGRWCSRERCEGRRPGPGDAERTQLFVPRQVWALVSSARGKRPPSGGWQRGACCGCVVGCEELQKRQVSVSSATPGVLIDLLELPILKVDNVEPEGSRCSPFWPITVKQTTDTGRPDRSAAAPLIATRPYQTHTPLQILLGRWPPAGPTNTMATNKSCGYHKVACHSPPLR